MILIQRYIVSHSTEIVMPIETRATMFKLYLVVSEIIMHKFELIDILICTKSTDLQKCLHIFLIKLTQFANVILNNLKMHLKLANMV